MHRVIALAILVLAAVFSSARAEVLIGVSLSLIHI